MREGRENWMRGKCQISFLLLLPLLPTSLENTFCRAMGKVTKDFAGLGKYTFLSISYADTKS